MNGRWKVGVRVQYSDAYLAHHGHEVLRGAQGTLVADLGQMTDGGEVLWEVAWDGEPEYVSRQWTTELRECTPTRLRTKRAFSHTDDPEVQLDESRKQSRGEM